MEDNTDNQGQNRLDAIKPYMWKKGQSGNILGRPKGKTMKEYARQYLERMTDDERDEWLEGIPKEKIWELAEGKAKQDIEADVKTNLTIEISEAVAKKHGIKQTDDTSQGTK